MALIIDGYNLLHESGIIGRSRHHSALQRSRQALLNALAKSISSDELSQTQVVFDAKQAPSGLPQTLNHQGIEVLFAVDYEEADDLIEELIRKHPTPRKLIVVSSDHRIQRAARRRRAKAIDSGAWLDDLLHPSQPSAASRQLPAEKEQNLTSEEIDHWLEQFSDRQIDASADTTPKTADSPSLKPGLQELENPFPPGYAEDLWDDDGSF